MPPELDLGGAESPPVAIAEPTETQQAAPTTEQSTDQTPPPEQPPLSDPFADLDAIAGIRKRDEAGRFESDKPKEEEPPEEPAKAAQTEDKAQDQEFLASDSYKRSKPLRDAYDKLRESHAKTIKELEELKSRSESGEVASALADENQQLKTKIKEYQAKQIVSDYTTSDEYQEKYISPIRQLIDMAVSEIEGVEIETAEGTRLAKKQDFLSLIEMPIKEASRYANALFGEAAPQILAMRQQVRTLNEQRKKAVELAEKNSEELSKKRLAEQAEAQRINQQIWQKADEKIVVRYPDLFGDVDGDDEHNKLMAKGLSDFDEAINPSASMSSEQRLTVMAGMRRYAAAFPATVRKLRRYEDRIDELESELKKLKASDPDSGGAPGTNRPSAKVTTFLDDPEAPWNK